MRSRLFLFSTAFLDFQRLLGSQDGCSPDSADRGLTQPDEGCDANVVSASLLQRPIHTFTQPEQSPPASSNAMLPETPAAASRDAIAASGSASSAPGEITPDVRLAAAELPPTQTLAASREASAAKVTQPTRVPATRSDAIVASGSASSTPGDPASDVRPQQPPAASNDAIVAKVSALSTLGSGGPSVRRNATGEATASPTGGSTRQLALVFFRLCQRLRSSLATFAIRVLESTPLADPVYGHDWACLGVLASALMLVDSKLLRDLKDTRRNNFLILMVQLLCWSTYAAYFTCRHGGRKGLMWVHGYLMDWMLSIDSLFLFYAVFRKFRTPRELRYRTLTSGLCSASFCRIALFFLLQQLSLRLDMARPLTAVGLILFGVRAGLAADGCADPCQRTTKVLRWILGSRYGSPEVYDVMGDNSFTFTYRGKSFVTFFFFVVVAMELLDFSLMVSVASAKVMQVPDLFIGCSSSVAAMFGLRAFFLLSQDYIGYLVDLKYAVCAIYVFTGCVVMQQRWVVMDVPLLLLMNALVFVACMVAFVAWQTKKPHGAEDLCFGVFEENRCQCLLH